MFLENWTIFIVFLASNTSFISIIGVIPENELRDAKRFSPRPQMQASFLRIVLGNLIGGRMGGSAVLCAVTAHTSTNPDNDGDSQWKRTLKPHYALVMQGMTKERRAINWLNTVGNCAT
jgi:hypothetical protein